MHHRSHRSHRPGLRPRPVPLASSSPWAALVVAFAASSGCSAPAPPSVPDASSASAPERPAPPTPAPALPAAARPSVPDPDAPPKLELADDGVDLLHDTLRALVKEGASEDGFAWALAHGLIAFGPTLETSAGRLAIDAIAAHAERETIGGRPVYRFPTQAATLLPVEPHRDLMARDLLSGGVPLDRALVTKDGSKITLARLIEDAEWAFTLPVSDLDWQRFAWSAGAFFERHGASDAIRTHRGEVPIRQIAEAAMGRLERETDFIAALMDEGRPERLEKRRQKIYAHACGGLHLVQAAVQGAALVGDPALLERARRQLAVVRFRWEAERAIYRKTLAANPTYAPLLLVQELKFFGHALETQALAIRQGVITASDDERRYFRQVAADLARTTEELKPLYAAQDSLRKSSPQTYNDLVGDGCHAIRGVALGREIFVRPAPGGAVRP